MKHPFLSFPLPQLNSSAWFLLATLWSNVFNDSKKFLELFFDYLLLFIAVFKYIKYSIKKISVNWNIKEDIYQYTDYFILKSNKIISI